MHRDPFMVHKSVRCFIPITIAIATAAVARSASGDPPKADPPAARFDIHIPVFGCLAPISASADADVKNQLRQAFQTYFPHVDVQSECGADFSQHYGVWENPASPKEGGDARPALLKSLATIRKPKSDGTGLEDFGASFGAPLLQHAVDSKWNATKATPIDGSGLGNFAFLVKKITLVSKSPVELQAPNKAELNVKASAEIDPLGFGWFPYDVHVSIVDAMSLEHRAVSSAACGTQNRKIACKSTKSYVIPALFGKSGTIDGATVPSIGCPLAEGLPLAFPVPKFGTSAEKLVFNYDRVHVGADGFTAGAAIVLGARAPVLTVTGAGAAVIVDSEAKTAQAHVSLTTTDMRPPLTVQWTVGGAVGSPQELDATGSMSFMTVPVPPQLSHATSISVTAKVTDADGVVRSGAGSVTVKLDIHETPVCHNKPYLPQCE